MNEDTSGPVAQTDSLGGAGSISPALQLIAVNGLSRAMDGFLSTKYPLTAFNEPYSAEGAGAFEPGGYIVPRSAPGWNGYGNAPLIQSPVSLLNNPIVYGILAVAVVLLIVKMAR